MPWTPPKRILRSGKEERDMSDADEAVKAKKGRFAKPRAIGCAVVIAVVLAAILAWALGFFRLAAVPTLPEWPSNVGPPSVRVLGTRVFAAPRRGGRKF